MEPGELAEVVAFVGNITEDPEAFGRTALVVQVGVIVHEAVSKQWSAGPATALTVACTR
jgi:hypothetical protein